MFGQVVIGPPGSGKTTYCHGMQQFLSGFKRNVVIINLDPANDTLPYKCDIDLSELISLSEVMEELKLGPNGGLIYCMEYLEKNLDWLKEKLSKYKNHYFLFDCPGQVELYTHNSAVKNIVERLTKWNYRYMNLSQVEPLRLRLCSECDYYHQQTKLRDGNVFTGILCTVGGG